MRMKAALPLLLIVLLHQKFTTGKTEPNPCCEGTNIIHRGGCLQKSPNGRHKTLLNCPYGMFMVDPSDTEEDRFTVDDGGILNINNGSYTVGVDHYCLTSKSSVTSLDENITLAEGTELVEVAMVCFFDDGDGSNLTFVLSGSLILTSVAFLLLTLIVHFLVPELRDLQGKCIMCLCFCLCLGYTFLGCTQLASIRNACVFVAFNTYFWMIATFFWMNVVSINVMKSTVFRNVKISDGRMLEIYSAYGWGMPIIFVLATYIAHHVDGDHIKPGFGHISCWFAGSVPTWSYFYGPILVLIVCNILLFVVTSFKLWNMKSYNNVTTLRSLKYKFMLYLKLFLVMGISWLFEILSFWHNTQHIVWVIADAFNCLQGVVFFLVLVVFRKRAMRGLAERGLLPGACIPKEPRSADEECEEIVDDEEETPSMFQTS